ncbi:DUF4365 domain-containing protein [Maribacter hydrothermalis]|uniref:DUF4365 domain-containing protein n=1 Tax=Maribacter hydrothermalis TaxID=1836467 RepID=A0A1B7ZCZ8_9FLAO|nr:DUF4365 domain-containing protein [Maribacter hydrothermalis]APQ18736.1 hypothetical protein BTR34_16055 [Maribacter hydrothermalis]OBR41003.1 hypothetical protein A9200_14355 [Maribacter hydrothermalis]
MKLPKRAIQHISESESYKLFQSKIPSSWIIREATERDYGIDCYIELVNDDNELTGELVLVQLKSRQKIPWTKDNTYKINGIDISTSNYWFKFAVPVFIFVADLELKELYFSSVGYQIKRNFREFAKQDKFGYKLNKRNLFEGKDGVFSFKFDYYYESDRPQFENELLFFLTNLIHFRQFQSEHSFRDYHLGIEDIDLIFFESMHRNFRFLSVYFNLDNTIPKLSEIKKRSREKFEDNYYELYEHDLAEWMEKFQLLTKEIIIGLKSFLKGEMDYWLITKPTVYNYIINLNPDDEY